LRNVNRSPKLTQDRRPKLIWTSPTRFDFVRRCLKRQPSVVKTDDAKWMLDDPPVNFVNSHRNSHMSKAAIEVQVESQDELREVYGRLHQAGDNIIEQGQTTCCYAHSEKSKAGLNLKFGPNTRL
jgi:hypothetical protein